MKYLVYTTVGRAGVAEVFETSFVPSVITLGNWLDRLYQYGGQTIEIAGVDKVVDDTWIDTQVLKFWERWNGPRLRNSWARDTLELAV